MALFADPSCFDGVAPIFSRGPFRIYLAGQAYSLADVAATPYIFRAEMLGLDKLWVGKRPGVEGWCARIRERLSFGRAIDYESGGREFESLRARHFLLKIQQLRVGTLRSFP